MIIEPRDTHALVAVITSLSDDRPRREAMGQAESACGPAELDLPHMADPSWRHTKK